MNFPHPNKKVVIGSGILLLLLAYLYKRHQDQLALAADAANQPPSLDDLYRQSMADQFAVSTRPVPYEDYPQYPQYPGVIAPATTPVTTPTTPTTTPTDGDGTTVGAGGGAPVMTPINNVPLGENPAANIQVKSDGPIPLPSNDWMPAIGFVPPPMVAPNPIPISLDPGAYIQVKGETPIVPPATMSNSPTTGPVVMAGPGPTGGVIHAADSANSPTTKPANTPFMVANKPPIAIIKTVSKKKTVSKR